EVLQHKGVLVAVPGGGDNTDRISLDGLERGGDLLVGVFPACLDKLPVLFVERGGQPVRAVDELERLVPADTDLTLVDRVALPGRDPGKLAVLDDQVDTATIATVGAGAWYVFEFHVLTSNTNCLTRRYIRLMKKYRELMNNGGLIWSRNIVYLPDNCRKGKKRRSRTTDWGNSRTWYRAALRRTEIPDKLRAAMK